VLERFAGIARTPLLLVLAQLAFLIAAVVARQPLTAMFTRDWGYDVVIYWQQSLALLRGSVPYVDFALEYPPLSLVPMSAPHIFGIQLDPTAYELRYLLVGVLLSTLVAITLLGILALERQAIHATRVPATYLVLLIPVALIALWRYDLFPAALTAVAVFALLRGTGAIAGACLGVAIGAKLYPIVLAPIFAAYLLVAGRRREAIRFAAVAVATTLIPVLPLLIVDAPAALSFLKYQIDRPLETETLPAGLLRLAGFIGLIPRPERLNAFSSENVVSPVADAILRVLPFAALALLSVVVVACVLRFREEQLATGRIATRTLVSYCVLAILAFLVTAKVLSPQYMVWLLPLAPFLSLRQAAVVAAIFALTSVVYPGMWLQLIADDPVPLVVLNARNVLLVALLVWLLLALAPGPRLDRRISP
jgi:glycosyl transferase family 87